MSEKTKLPVFSVPFTGKPMNVEIRALGALIARAGKVTNGGNVEVRLEQSEIDNVRGVMIYSPTIMEVTLAADAGFKVGDHIKIKDEHFIAIAINGSNTATIRPLTRRERVWYWMRWNLWKRWL